MFNIFGIKYSYIIINKQLEKNVQDIRKTYN